jgi:hypothetical protein
VCCVQRSHASEHLGQTDVDAEGPDRWTTLTDAGWLTFVEPNLAFPVACYVAKRVHLRRPRVRGRPPPVDATAPDWYEVVLDVARDEVLAAAAAPHENY